MTCDTAYDDRVAHAAGLATRCRRAWLEVREGLGDIRVAGSDANSAEVRRPAPGPRSPTSDGTLDALNDCDDILSGWAANLRDDYPELRPIGSRRTSNVAGWLADHAFDLAAAAWYGDAVREIEEVTDRLERITTPPERTPAPVDATPRDLTPGAAAAALVPADVVTVLTAADVFVTAGHIDRWIRAGWLVPAGKSKRGRRTYRVGDVYALAMRSVAPKIPPIPTA